MDLASALIVLLVVLTVLGIGAACEVGTRPKVEAHDDDWDSEGNSRGGGRW